MKKIDCILKGKKLMDRLIVLRKKEINRHLEAAKDSIEKQKVKAEIRYEELMNLLGYEDVDYESVINKMIEQKGIIMNGGATLEVIAEITADLNQEVEEPAE